MSVSPISASHAYQVCVHPDCQKQFGVDQILSDCPECGSLLDVSYEWDKLQVPRELSQFEARWATRRNPLDYSGVWRFRNLLPFAEESFIVTIGEGQTVLQDNAGVAEYAGINKGGLFLQYEGLNPSGSFKDNGMTAASTHANIVNAQFAACASTGNTSASLAIYAGTTGLFKCVVFVGSGKIAYGKLSQALDYGSKTLQVQGDFDDALMRVREVCGQNDIYLCNSVNPFRLEGQKSIMYRVLEGLNWQVPDWIVVPGGNLGNSSAFGKAFMELKHLGLIDKVPRLAIINAAGSNTLCRLYNDQKLRWNDGRPDMETINGFYDQMTAENRRATTLASAIQINRPVNLTKALRALDFCDGVVRDVSDQQILDAKAKVGQFGFGCEPASGASVAGAKLLREEGVIAPSDRVVCILTGHQLKDADVTVAYHSGNQEKFDTVLRSEGVTSAPFSNPPTVVPNDLPAILAQLAAE